MRRILIALITGLLFTIPVTHAQQSANDYDLSAEAEIMRYINAVNLGDYVTAYNMLQPENQTYDEYVAGYAATVRIVPYFGHSGVATGSIYVTTVLFGFQTDGTIESYYGYFRLVNAGNFSPSSEGVVLSGAHFEQIADGIAVSNAILEHLLSQPYSDETAESVRQLSTINEISHPFAEVVMNYYDQINAGDFAGAYDQWLSPAGQGVYSDFRPDYNEFVRGYDDTVYVTAYTGAIQAVPQQQRRDYLAAFVPAVLVGQHTDGGFVAYYGCYAIGILGEGEFGILNGRFYPLAETAPASEAVFEALNTVHCPSINIAV